MGFQILVTWGYELFFCFEDSGFWGLRASWLEGLGVCRALGLRALGHRHKRFRAADGNPEPSVKTVVWALAFLLE